MVAKVRLRKFIYRNLVDKADPELRKANEVQYEFSNGRRFLKRKNRNRTA